jgi:ATP-dependent Clp endopeptidase proteolytic subunit ClpP
MSLYDETPKPQKIEEPKEEPKEESIYATLNDILSSCVDFKDSVIYLDTEIMEHTLIDFIIKVRSILEYRTTEKYEGEKDAPINLILNSPGGDIHEMLGLIDYINTLNVKVNIICRGKALSAAAIILVCATGQRMVSKNSTIMFHQASSFVSGKLSDITATIEYVKKIESDLYALLAEKTNCEASWWEGHMKSDLFLTAQEALDIGVIDTII